MTNESGLSPSASSGAVGTKLAENPVAATPSASWRANGLTDPHDNRYDCERAALVMGHLSDDALANGAFLNYDRRPDPQEIIDRKAFSPIMWMTAVKDRIRWLSRSLEQALALQADVREIISAYVADERRYLDGKGEPYGSISTDIGLRARALVAAAPTQQQEGAV